ncbi:hypothetical protein COCVIDRAFT_24841 [Bipolaris victoriae FI3]|uniref:Uncharacterized protein n=1 Tax=Bipolaris victoriae (strain FI3) TaxID=930091 RepID=W7EYH8_BIPV3|nr:hypothetical protein COCVIDRAFT_24841 [Bipolaris victoriae FI3]
MSIIKNIFKSQAQGCNIQPDLEHSWGPCLQTLEGHGSRTESVVFSPDGTSLAFVSHYEAAQIWDARTFSPDRTKLASASDDTTIKIWDAKNGERPQTFEEHDNWVSSVAFSPDGTTLVLASNEIIIWDTQDWQCLKTLKKGYSFINSVAFSLDGTRLASASDVATIKIWDMQSRYHLQTLESHSGRIDSVAFSPDGTRMVSMGNEVKIWDAYSGRYLQTVEGPSRWTQSVAFSPDGAHILTNEGKFHLDASISGTTSNIINFGDVQNVDRDICVDRFNNWILLEGEKIL